MNILEFLNSSSGRSAFLYGLLGLVVWILLWKFLLGRLLQKCRPSSFGYSVYELGAGGSFCVILFLVILAVLFIASIQAVIGIGLKMIFPLLLFWGIVVAFLVFVIRKLRK